MQAKQLCYCYSDTLPTANLICSAIMPVLEIWAYAHRKLEPMRLRICRLCVSPRQQHMTHKGCVALEVMSGLSYA
jgi:hypothetical protein